MSEHLDMDDKLSVLGIDPDIPPNSDVYKQKMAEKAKDKKPVPEYTITRKEKTFGQKLKEAVFGEDVKNVPEHVFFNIIVPNVMRMFGDTISGALNMTFRGLNGGKSNYRDDGSPYRNYDRMYDRQRRSAAPSGDMNFEDYIFNNRYGVEHVIDELDDILDRYGVITAADVCTQIGKTPRSVDNKWGWRSTRDFEPVPVGEGWILSVPKARYLD